MGRVGVFGRRRGAGGDRLGDVAEELEHELQRGGIVLVMGLVWLTLFLIDSVIREVGCLHQRDKHRLRGRSSCDHLARGHWEIAIKVRIREA